MLRTALVTTAVAAALVAAGSAQSRRDAMSCNDRSYNNDRATHCEVREDTIGGANPLDIDAGRNGGIRVRGWDRGDVLVRTKIQASANTDADARRLVAGVRVDTGGGRVRADGPDTNRDESWSVSFEINVPRTAMLTLNTNNGGISIDDFRGTAKFHARNGGLTLRQRRRRPPRRDDQRRRHRRSRRRSLGRLRPRRRNPQRRHPADAAERLLGAARNRHDARRHQRRLPRHRPGPHPPPSRDDARLGRPEAARDHDQRRGSRSVNDDPWAGR